MTLRAVDVRRMSRTGVASPGPTETVGVVLCPGYHDYVDLVNEKGGGQGLSQDE